MFCLITYLLRVNFFLGQGDRHVSCDAVKLCDLFCYFFLLLVVAKQPSNQPTQPNTPLPRPHPKSPNPSNQALKPQTGCLDRENLHVM